MRKKFERQLAEKNTEISMVKDKLLDSQKKIDMLNLELAGLKDANDKNNM
jgi:septal ring factor EnvC (AmiA/AmiB activator)